METPQLEQHSAAASALAAREMNAPMPRGIVIAVNAERAVFAIETEDGQCAVFWQHFGPDIQPGDILEGAVAAHGTRVLLHSDGPCAAVADSGPVTREEALARVRNGLAAGGLRPPGSF
jgi:hypothetical protein